MEAAFFSTYLEKGIFAVSPFETLDADGVGQLVQIAADAGGRTPGPQARGLRRTRRRPGLLHFFHKVGLDYVSCSPFRIPVARLEAGRAAVL